MTPLISPQNSKYPTRSIDGDYIGQEVTIECNEGFEFTDTPAAYTAPKDNTAKLSKTWTILEMFLDFSL